MSQNKNEEAIVKEALRKEYLSRISKELEEELSKKQMQSVVSEIRFDDYGDMQFRSLATHCEDLCQALRVCTNYLASRLSNARTEQWLKDYQNQVKKNE